MTDEDVLNKYKSFISLSKKDSDIIFYLKNRFNDSLSIKESYWRILHKIFIRPVCVICGNHVEFIGRKNIIFKKTCSKDCELKLKSNINIGKQINSESIEKAKITKLKKYGDKNYNNRIKAKQTSLEKYGVDIYSKSKEYIEKNKQTCLEKYGVSHQSKLDSNNFKCNNPQKIINIKEKTKLTNNKKYGGNSPMNNKSILYKQRQSLINNNKDNWWWKKDDFKKMMSNITSSKIVQEKIKNTCLKKYNETSFSKTKLFKSILNNKQEIIKQKIYNTHKQNNSFNISKQEDECYNILKEKYPDIVRQYKSDKYPFACDFYIPSLDLYIEYNGSWTHGNKPFENTKEDNIKLEYWKSKNTKYYNNAIQTWTIRDPQKRKIAKENNLNYLEIWNIKDLIEWLNLTK